MQVALHFYRYRPLAQTQRTLAAINHVANPHINTSNTVRTARPISAANKAFLYPFWCKPGLMVNTDWYWPIKLDTEYTNTLMPLHIYSNLGTSFA